jgi:hypothetical protein
MLFLFLCVVFSCSLMLAAFSCVAFALSISDYIERARRSGFRYGQNPWDKERKKERIINGMHQLLPSNTRAFGAQYYQLPYLPILSFVTEHIKHGCGVACCGGCE